jgi:CDP-4-dehydro-6-deoxyglucose reductase
VPTPSVAIRLLPADVVVHGLPGEPILDALRRNGYAHRFGCRRGGCGVCRIDLLDGTTTDNALVSELVLSPHERAQGVRLTCRAVPNGPITVRLRDEDRLQCVSSFLARYVNNSSATKG